MVTEEIALASHILSHEGALDAFGHVSLRDPESSARFLLSRARSPELVQASDMLRFGLDSEPFEPAPEPLFSERVIHGCIYQQRPDVNAICHLHAVAVMPFCISGREMVPVTHVGASIGKMVPFWSMQEGFGDTNMLVSTREQGSSLAGALGQNSVVLMRNHGAVVVAKSLRELVFRTIYLCLNAQLQRQAIGLGGMTRLTDREIELASKTNSSPPVLQRAWDYWTARLVASRGKGGATHPTA